MAIETFLNALPKYVKAGDKFRAPCPVHGGKDNNLMINERQDGSVRCYCFVCGATALPVADALSIARKECFPEDNGYKRPAFTREMQTTEAQDRLVVAMADAKPWDSLSLQDKRRVKLAKSRIESFEEMRARSE